MSTETIQRDRWGGGVVSGHTLSDDEIFSAADIECITPAGESEADFDERWEGIRQREAIWHGRDSFPNDNAAAFDAAADYYVALFDDPDEQAPDAAFLADLRRRAGRPQGRPSWWPGDENGNLPYGGDDWTVISDGLTASKGRNGLQALMAREFAPLSWVVPNIIPEGTTLLAAAPKIGKSWLSLDLAGAAATGGQALGSVWVGEARPVLLIDLESGERRLQERIRIQGWDWKSAEAFSYHLDRATAMDAFQEFMQEFRGSRPLVIVDTLAAIQTERPRDKTQYAHDYDTLTRFQAITRRDPGSAVFINHHTKKGAVGDAMESVSGTFGISGAVDTPMTLGREDRHSTKGLLNVMARDFEGGEFAIEFGADCRWRLTGGSPQSAAKAQKIAAMQSKRGNLGPGKTAALEIVESLAPNVASVADVERLYVGESRERVRKYLAELADSGFIERAGRGEYRAMAAD